MRLTLAAPRLVDAPLTRCSTGLLTCARLRLALAAAALAACGNAGAQEWRTLDVSRQLHDTTALSANITYGAGTLTLGPTTGADLYEMHLRYPAGRTSPVATYNPAGHALHLGIKSQNFSMPGGDADQNELRIGLARGVPLDLTTEVAAADVKIDLGGLAVRNLTLKTGATDATLAFSSPNTIKMHSMALNVGAAGFKGTGLANANADHIRLRAGIGSWDLYFDGTWTGDIWLDAKIGLGSLTIHVPDDVRVDQNANAVLGAVSGDNGPSTVIIDTSDNDNADEADTSDDGNSSDDATVKAHAAVKASVKASVKAALKAAPSAKVKKNGAVTIVQMSQTPTSAAPTPRFTLHIVGGATLGEITIDHKLGGAGGQ
jgi:hypothetical protein